MSTLHFITSIPLNVRRGSGGYVAMRTLAEALRRLGIDVELVTPRVQMPVYTATRVLFNEILRWRQFRGDATVGIDVDGYSVAGRRNSLPHVACIKGVLGDAVRFERGGTWASMALQAELEAKHARCADLVITVSQYCADRLAELYRVSNAVVVPELIFVEPENPESLAEGIIRLYRDPDLRGSLASSGLRDVEQFEMSRIGRRFMSAVASVAPGLRLAEGYEFEHAG